MQLGARVASAVPINSPSLSAMSTVSDDAERSEMCAQGCPRRRRQAGLRWKPAPYPPSSPWPRSCGRPEVLLIVCLERGLVGGGEQVRAEYVGVLHRDPGGLHLLPRTLGGFSKRNWSRESRPGMYTARAGSCRVRHGPTAARWRRRCPGIRSRLRRPEPRRPPRAPERSSRRRLEGRRGRDGLRSLFPLGCNPRGRGRSYAPLRRRACWRRSGR